MSTSRQAPGQHVLAVESSEWLTPHLVRVVAAGESLAGFADNGHTDAYVKLLFVDPALGLAPPYDLAALRATLPAHQQPVVRTYTVRRWRPEVPELWLDFVVHGDVGIAGPWAAAAKVGDPIHFMGPGGGYTPDPAAGWHLLAGDESALPAIGAALEGMPAGATVKAFIEVEDATEEQKLETPADAEITWLRRDGRPVGEALVAAVRALSFPPGQVHAFVHGEATFVKDLRALLRVERGLPLSQLSISGYWRRGMNEDGWQSSKREWNQQVEQEQEQVTT
jgi:NADPH-dependent ferric siderophore reductase